MATMMFANWETQDEEKRWGYRLAPYQIAKEKVFGVSDFLSYRLRFIACQCDLGVVSSGRSLGSDPCSSLECHGYACRAAYSSDRKDDRNCGSGSQA